MADDKPTVLFLCTGNAARSVMAAIMLRELTDAVTVTSAGTHSIPGLPMSTRTRTALAGHGLADTQHLSAQLEQPMVDEATIIAVFEPMHVSYMRKKHAGASSKVASLRRLARDLAPGSATSVAARLADLDLASHDFEPWEEVIDPAGGDLGVFEASAAEIAELVRSFAAKLAEAPDVGS